MKNKFIYLFISCCLAIFLTISACKQLLITPDEVGNEPVRNFELFWNDVNKTYPFFTDDNIDWQAIYDKYRPQVTSNTSTLALFEILKQMMIPLMDGHRSLSYKDIKGWGNPPRYREYDKYNFRVIKNQYLQNFSIKTQPYHFNPNIIDTALILGTTIGGKYAYLGVRTFYTNDDINIAELVAAHLAANPQTQGIILDLRNNGGGRLGSIWGLMSLFASYDVPYATYQPKVGPLKDNLMPLDLLTEADFVIPRGGQFSNKKIVVITNRWCYSSTEHAALAAKRMGLPIVGDTTGGALSLVVEKTLPNGIKYVLVNSRTLDINGKLWERIGVPPSHPIATQNGDFSFKDPYMDKALTLLPSF